MMGDLFSFAFITKYIRLHTVLISQGALHICKMLYATVISCIIHGYVDIIRTRDVSEQTAQSCYAASCEFRGFSQAVKRG